jgi:hypothetical protein
MSAGVEGTKNPILSPSWIQGWVYEIATNDIMHVNSLELCWMKHDILMNLITIIIIILIITLVVRSNH